MQNRQLGYLTKKIVSVLYISQSLENRENRDKNNGQGILFWAKSQGISFQNADCHENFLLFLSIIEKVSHGIHQYESAHASVLYITLLYILFFT